MNRKIVIVAVGVALVLVGAYGAYRFGLNRGGQQAQHNDLIDPATGKRILYWHDPMVPGQRFEKPGKSPYMDMPLVPVFAQEGADKTMAGGVTIHPRAQQRLGVRTALVEKKSLAIEVTAAGTVEYNERDVAVVQARANGFIEHVYVRTPLQVVSAGQALADVYFPDWVAAQEEYLAVQRMQSDAGESLLAAATQRMRLVGMSDEHITAVTQSKTVQPRMTLRAPIAGVVTELTAREGMTVMNGAALFRINGVDTVWVYGEVPEAQIEQINPGLAVTATATALPGVTLQGKVLALLPEVSRDTRTAKARIELLNTKRLLSSGMFVTIHFVLAPQVAVLTVPTEAVIATGDRSVVVVSEEGGRFRPVVVETGAESDGATEIRSGLEDGQQVVVSAQFLIDSEASLKAAMERMGDVPAFRSSPSPQPSPSPELRSTSPGTGRGAELPLPVPGEGRGEGEGQHDRAARDGDHK
jgi:membrane fusion protein, copper/silver efflux system